MNKKIFVIGFSLTLSLSALASSVAETEVNLCNRTVFTSMSDCNSAKGNCLELPQNDPAICGVYKLKDLYGSQKFDGESCEGKSECELLLTEKTCSVNKWPLIDADYTEVYCVEVVGKKIEVDEVLKSQKLAQKAASDQFEGALNLAKKLRECGGRVMDLMLVRNQPKNLTTAQVKELVATYEPIQGLLSSGSLNSAKEEIAAVTADGVLVTNADKTALTNEINKCLSL